MVFDLWKVSSVSATATWAVGFGGVILRWNGATWLLDSSLTQLPALALSGAWGSDASNIWAVGTDGISASVVAKWNEALGQQVLLAASFPIPSGELIRTTSGRSAQVA